MRTRIALFDGWEFALHPGFGSAGWDGADGLAYHPVTLPHDWAVSRPGGRDVRQGQPQGFFDRWGTGFYRRTLAIDPEPGAVYRLRFDGVMEHSQVRLDGRALGGWDYGYTPFAVELPADLAGGEHQLAVRVDNTSFPADRWYSGAGVYRMVWLEAVPADHLEREEMTLETALLPDGVRVTIGVAHPGRKRVTLRGDGRVWQRETEGERAVFEDAALRLWSAEHPFLYELTVELLDGERTLDSLTFPVGLRTVAADPERGVLINGVPTKLRGVCVHQDGGCLGTAVNGEFWRERLETLKGFGCNALRLAHHLYMPEMLDLADELGFYVYEEAFDKWTAGSYGRRYDHAWKDDLEAMVLRDRTRPSIILWGVGNEVENQAHGGMLELLANHVAAVKALDRTRPVSVAMNPHFAWEERHDLKDVEDIQVVVDEMKTGEILDIDAKVGQIAKIAALVDVLCCNYMEQWYDQIHAAIPDKPVLGTEIYQYFRGRGEKFQAFWESCPWLDAERRDWCAGGFVWSGFDYLGESAVWPYKGWSGAPFAADMEPRPMAFAFRSWWSDEPVVHFAALDMAYADRGVKEHWEAPAFFHHWDFPQYSAAMIPYMVATNCEEVEIRLGDKTCRSGPVRDYPNRIVRGWLPWTPGRITVVGLRDGREVCRDELVTPGAPSALVFDSPRRAITLRRDGAGRPMPFQLLCKVRALDGEGNPVFHTDEQVAFTVEGAGTILGTDNGDLGRPEGMDARTIHLFQGRTSAALRLTAPGTVTLTAAAPGLKPARMDIVVE